MAVGCSSASPQEAALNPEPRILDRRPSPRVAAIVAVTGVALVLRVWGLDFGLPYAEARPDELRLDDVRFLM